MQMQCYKSSIHGKSYTFINVNLHSQMRFCERVSLKYLPLFRVFINHNTINL